MVVPSDPSDNHSEENELFFFTDSDTETYNNYQNDATRRHLHLSAFVVCSLDGLKATYMREFKGSFQKPQQISEKILEVATTD